MQYGRLLIVELYNLGIQLGLEDSALAGFRIQYDNSIDEWCADEPVLFVAK